jgi:hypothetical protein
MYKQYDVYVMPAGRAPCSILVLPITLNVVHMNINMDYVLVLRENIMVTKLVYYEIFQDPYDAIARA